MAAEELEPAPRPLRAGAGAGRGAHLRLRRFVLGLVSAGAPPARCALQAAPDGGSGGLAATDPDRPTSAKDAARLLDQASFGPSEEALAEAMRQGPRKYLLAQMDQPVSRYSYSTPAAQRRSAIHTAGAMDFCQTVAGGQENCWRDYYSSLPVQWEFFRHAVSNPDQLRQRLAFALSQIMVTSDRELDGTYGFAEYHQMLRDHAFGNYRTVLEKVITSPFMGAYLNMADNDPADPNENFAREMLQLFSIGACELDGGRLAARRQVRRHLQQRGRAQLCVCADRMDLSRRRRRSLVRRQLQQDPLDQSALLPRRRCSRRARTTTSSRARCSPV